MSDELVKDPVKDPGTDVATLRTTMGLASGPLAAELSTPLKPIRASTLHLYDTTNALAILDEMIEEYHEQLELNGGDIEAIPEIAQLLAYAEGEWEAAVERWGLAIAALRVEHEAVKLERVRLEQIERRKGNAVERLKQYLKRTFEARGVTKLNFARVTVRVQVNSAAEVRAETETVIEDLYAQGSSLVEQQVSYKLDRDAILRLHKAGEDLPAGLIVRKGTHLRVS